MIIAFSDKGVSDLAPLLGQGAIASCQAKRRANTVNARRNVTPIAANNPEKKNLVARSLTRPCRCVPAVAPMTAPGTPQTIKFQGVATNPPSFASWTRWASAAPTTVAATTSVDVAAATGTGNRERRTSVGSVASPTPVDISPVRKAPI